VIPSWRLRSDSVDGLVLYVSYQWALNQKDLDSGIFFLGFAQGYSCSPESTTYLTFGGDEYNGGEFYTISLGKAWANGQWTGSTTVELRAGWNGNVNQGLASLTLFTTHLVNGTPVNDNNEITFVIDPPIRLIGQCSPQIAFATVARGLDGTVTITIPK
jgi:hypothetical protein